MKRTLAAAAAAVSLAGVLAVATPAEAATSTKPWPGRSIRPYVPPSWGIPGPVRIRPVWTWLYPLPRPCPSGKVC